MKRRGLLASGLSAAAVPMLGGFADPRASLRSGSQASLARAYAFLDAMLDLYFKRGTRLVQSFVPTHALKLGDIGYTYDNALCIVAFAQRASRESLAKAGVLGDSLVYAQAHDPFADGRVRDGYHVDPFVRADGSVRIAFGDGDGGSDCGNMAWTGLALSQLYARTGATRYLNAALALASFVYEHAYDTRGAGGYTGGLTQNQHAISYKATEHNIDLYAFFTLLATFTHDSNWSAAAAHALDFLPSMWNASAGFYWTGTLDDGVTINTSFIPEDVQTWSYLATGDPATAASIDWAAANLAATDGMFAGVSFSNADTSGVWFEGTSHLAAALLARNASGDGAKAAAYLADLVVAQRYAPNGDGRGIDAASKDGLKTGDGDKYFAALHVGATAWYCLAAQSGNPFRLP